jgi:hypothetical protein
MSFLQDQTPADGRRVFRDGWVHRLFALSKSELLAMSFWTMGM